MKEKILICMAFAIMLLNSQIVNAQEKIKISAAGVEFTLVRVDSGSFVMGALKNDADAFDWVKPAHKVTITRPYYIGQTEVTQELYSAVMGVNPSAFNLGGNFPVERVSYFDAMRFCSRLSELTGHTFTLPTEAQWEYAAKGGQNTNTITKKNVGDVAWYDANSNDQTHAVASKQANELGLYDMLGNVWEWCLDWFGNYSTEPLVDPHGPAKGESRVFRGGSWIYEDRTSSVTERGFTKPEQALNDLGFRVVMLK